MKNGAPVKDAVSAGGVVWRRADDEVEIVLCGRSSERLWGLPKGTPDPGETPEQTAIREVQEETGLIVDLGPPVGTIDYWFTMAGVRYHKRVHHWLMTPAGGDLSLHDHEFDQVLWVRAGEAAKLLTYQNERRIVADALRLIESQP
ncbi:MAG: NUDIX hydrolase [Dehalococcoidia bacterium]